MNLLGPKKEELFEKFTNYMKKISQDAQMKEYSNLLMDLLNEYKNP